MLDDFCHGSFRGIFLWLVEERAVEIEDVISMGNTTAVFAATCQTDFRRLCQESGIGRLTAVLVLQARPCEGGPCKAHVTEQVATAVNDFLLSAAWIEFLGFVSEVAEIALQLLLERLDG